MGGELCNQGEKERLTKTSSAFDLFLDPKKREDEVQSMFLYGHLGLSFFLLPQKQRKK